MLFCRMIKRTIMVTIKMVGFKNVTFVTKN